jgi:2-iminobutanoate/2-iminopropanoate deaminase
VQLTLSNPETVPAPFGDRFAHVARLDLGDGALLILAGQIAVDGTGQVVSPGDITGQSQCIFELIREILAARGATFAEIMHLRTFMTSFDDPPGYGAVRRRLFHGTPPASTTVEVSMTREADMPKASPEAVAVAIFDAVDNREEEIFPDPASAPTAAHWRDSAAKLLERQLAQVAPVGS